MMRSVLILYATREGQTEKIAKQIAKHLEHNGLKVYLVDARDASVAASLDLSAYDVLVFGASMHAGGLEQELVRFVNRNADQIERMPRSFFLVTLSAATKQDELRTQSLADAQRKMSEQLLPKFDDIEMIAGALTYSKYAAPVRWLMRRISRKAGGDTDVSRDYEYTDWSQVKVYADRLLK